MSKKEKKIRYAPVVDVVLTCDCRHSMTSPRCKDCVYYGVQCERFTKTVKKKPFECDEVDISIIYRDTGKYKIVK